MIFVFAHKLNAVPCVLKAKGELLVKMTYTVPLNNAIFGLESGLCVCLCVCVCVCVCVGRRN